MSRATKKKSNYPNSDKTLKEVAIAKFTRDECLIIESFLAQYKMVISSSNDAALVRVTNPVMQPIIKLNRANYSKLRYKIENIINPKSI